VPQPEELVHSDEELSSDPVLRKNSSSKDGANEPQQIKLSSTLKQKHQQFNKNKDYKLAIQSMNQ